MDAGLGARVADDADGLARTFAGTGVGLGALAAHGQTAQMANSPITFDALQALEVHADFAAEIAFDDVLAILNGMNDLGELRFGQILGADARVDLGAGEDVYGVARANAVNVTQGDVDAFVRGNFYSDDTSHLLVDG